MSSLDLKPEVKNSDIPTEKCSLTMSNELENGVNDGGAGYQQNITRFKKSQITINMELLRNLDDKPCDFADSESGPSITSTSKNIKSLDIGFTNLSYSVKTLLTRENRPILRRLNGEFRSKELTAVMGPSGAGKSTLLDVLSGYTTQKVQGRITINGRLRDPKKFRRQSAYIMQDHNLQPQLTVIEAMRFSANLKLGDNMTIEEKNTRISNILEAIKLAESRKTLTGKLSGGQKKRLSIALELVNNPPVMFFDEPTSGLDSSTSTQCMALLKMLANEGRTIICTIHQPSALVFEMFDHLYAIAEGQCIYTGTTKNLVPFLKQLDLECPKNYNPSDYLLEISTHDYGVKNPGLIEKTENGMSTKYRKSQVRPHTAQILAMEKAEKMMKSGLMTPVYAPSLSGNKLELLSPVIETPTAQIDLVKPKTKPGLQIDPSKICKRDDRYSASFWRQFILLYHRTFIIYKRDHSLVTMRIGIHLVVSLFIGLMYFSIGNEAHHIYNNFKYVFFSIMFLMFTAFSSMTMAFPLELPIITREHFNRWYSLKAYYTAMTIADIPIQLFCTLLYILITYFMTNQPVEPFRFGMFFLICLMVTLVAQSLGLLTGSLFSVKHAAIFGPFFICPFLIFSGFFVQISDAPSYSQWLFHISFLKYALEGAALAIFGYDRKKMECNEMFCQYMIPKKFMRDIKMDESEYMHAFLALVIIFFIFRVAAYFVMLYKLKHKR